jgi:hypothetical protein
MQPVMIFLLWLSMAVPGLEFEPVKPNAAALTPVLAPPVITCPPSITVSCRNYDPTLWAYGEATATDPTCPDPAVITAAVSYNLFDTICNRGTIVRTFTATNCEGASSQCTQQIVVEYEQDYFVRFPNDVVTSAENPDGEYGTPTFYGEDCELMGISYSDEVFADTTLGNCLRIERTWHIINWCTFDPTQPLTWVPNPNPSATPGNPINFVGPVVSSCNPPANTPPAWLPTTVKITPFDPAPTNYCLFYFANANGYEYRQIIRINGVAAPVVSGCPVAPVQFNDPTANDTLLWNAVFDTAQAAIDWSEAPADLQVQSSGTVQRIDYVLSLDLDSDGTRETVVSSTLPQTPGVVRYGNYGTPNLGGGTPVAFDLRPVAANVRWRFAVEQIVTDSTHGARVRWNTVQAPGTFVTPELPAGSHTIQWIVTGACGQVTNCAYSFYIPPAFDPAPVSVSCPPDATVSCEAFDATLEAYGYASATAGCLDTLLVSISDADFNAQCNTGVLVRTFTATDCENASASCVQTIEVAYEQDYFIRFPNDVVVTDCPLPESFGEPVFFGQDCETLSLSHTDEMFTIVPDACYRIERTWHVINWCTFDAAQPLVYVPNPSPNANAASAINLVGPVVSACGTTGAWASTTTKILPTDAAPTDYCTFFNVNANGYEYKQIIKIIGLGNPEVSNCPAEAPLYPDSTVNDPMSWSAVYDPAAPAQDLTETPVDLQLAFTDPCQDPNVDVQYLLYLDLDGNGTRETVVNSAADNAPNVVLYGNSLDPAFLAGTPVAFDDRPVPTAEKWKFALEVTPSTDGYTAAVRWTTEATPSVFAVPELPAGNHRVRWIVTNACGNTAVCDYAFTVANGITSAAHTAPGGERRVRVVPNPTAETFELRIAGAASDDAYTFVLTNALGQVVHRQSFTGDRLTVEAGALPRGCYGFRIEYGAAVAGTGKVILH